MDKLKTILIITRDVSAILLIWFVILTSVFTFQARGDCLEFGAPHAVLTPAGTVCVVTAGGTEFFATLATLRTEADVKSKDP